jgi:hypothetical protein
MGRTHTVKNVLVLAFPDGDSLGRKRTLNETSSSYVNRRKPRAARQVISRLPRMIGNGCWATNLPHLQPPKTSYLIVKI